MAKDLGGIRVRFSDGCQFLRYAPADPFVPHRAVHSIDVQVRVDVVQPSSAVVCRLLTTGASRTDDEYRVRASVAFAYGWMSGWLLVAANSKTPLVGPFVGTLVAVGLRHSRV